jgi:hypothetical protein
MEGAMMFLRNSLLFLLFFYSAISVAVRDIFKLEQQDFVRNPLLSANINDLNFVGAIIQKDQRFGFVEDALGNIGSVSLGQSVGNANMKVIKILKDQILVANRQQYISIK